MTKFLLLCCCFIFLASTCFADESDLNDAGDGNADSGDPTSKQGQFGDNFVPFRRPYPNPNPNPYRYPYPYPQPYPRPYPQPPQPSTPNEDKAVESLITYYIAKLLVKYLYPTTTTTAETTTVETTTVESTTLPVTTTPNLCDSWPQAHSCRYQVFSEKVTWNAAKARCPTMCGSVLAHKNVRSSADLNTVLFAINSPAPTAKIWLGLSDEDSFVVFGPLPLWGKTDAVSPAIPTTAYKTAPGSPGCGYYTAAAANTFEFESCFQVKTETPAYFLCEAC